MLNRTKGPAMHSPRAQADKKHYQFAMKQRVESQPLLTLRQEIVEGLLIERRGPEQRIAGVLARGDTLYRAAAVVLTTGTFLKAIMHTGESQTRGGRAGDGTAEALSDSLTGCGFELARFKTGTPCRLNGRTINFDVLEPQPGDEKPQPFSFATDRIEQQQLHCHITYTNEQVHELICDAIAWASRFRSCLAWFDCPSRPAFAESICVPIWALVASMISARLPRASLRRFSRSR